MQFKRKRVYSDMPKRPVRKEASVTLKGWQQIADFLGEPQSVVQRRANEGMPVRKEGRLPSDGFSVFVIQSNVSVKDGLCAVWQQAATVSTMLTMVRVRRLCLIEVR